MPNSDYADLDDDIGDLCDPDIEVDHGGCQ
jgi:hypothetical protein